MYSFSVLHEASGKGSNKKDAKKAACQQVLELLTAPSSPEKVKDEIQIDEPITPDESLELEVEPTPSPLKPTKTCDPSQPRRISFAEEPTIIEIPNREMLKREQAEYKRLKRKLERKSRNRASAMLPQYVPQYSKSQSNGHFSYDQRGGYYDQFGCYYPIYPNQSGYNRNFYSGYNNQYYCQNAGYRYYWSRFFFGVLDTVIVDLDSFLFCSSSIKYSLFILNACILILQPIATNMIQCP